ncbi:hypothetical protein K504DRAFT_367505 [Pleomassaria siparia CBS 279.74]|uniref:SH3 domain signaling protein n=1 Tax=Pleomassaria siparia CBS 279.74 TaxID=1314801 RepID=A0A6G1KSK8_9PLEO|nr:hypothetical protein K504DRAFT_367505 [Pleomassaria siparia CBS 279.74]
MQRVQRLTGRFMTRTPNEADVEGMLRDFADSDKMLEKIEAAARQWRDAWTNILNHQLLSAECFYTIYKPLGAKSAEYGGRVCAETPPAALERCQTLQEAFAELKTDMMEEVKDIEKKLVIPAKLAKDALKPMHKSIKRREEKKLDYERYKSRCEALQNKKARSDRDNAALNKHEQDLARATHDYEYADEALRSSLPRLNGATFSILPHLLTNQIILQNNLIGNLYTVLHHYSHSNGYPDPPPELEEVVPVWESSFTSLRKEMESGFELLKGGKAIHQPMRLPDKGETLTGLGIRNKVIPGRKTTPGEPSTSPPVSRGRVLPHGRSPSTDSTDIPPPAYINLQSKPSYSSLSASKPKIGSSYSSPKIGASQSLLSAASYASSNTTNTTNGHDDYFGRSELRPRIGSTTSASSGFSNPAAGKKKPPPPPPKKIGSLQGEFVVAIYDFDAASQGDLSFREGDRIRIVKKTNSTQDWWEGELRGQKGSFPANYCK